MGDLGGRVKKGAKRDAGSRILWVLSSDTTIGAIKSTGLREGATEFEGR